MRKILAAAALVAFTASGAALADTAIPEKRVTLEQGVDFYGGDVGERFDVAFEACINACLSEDACKAFTYNMRASACFLKSGVETRTPFEGALSGLVLPNPPDLVEQGEARAEAVSFLPGGHLRRATMQAETIATRFPLSGGNPETLARDAEEALRNGDAFLARELYGEAVALTDAPDHWVDLARVMLVAEPENWRERQELERHAPAAALNGYLRAASPAQEAQALMVLAEALERREEGRASLDALKLAAQRSGRKDIASALERAYELFGFRVVEHTADSNAAEPRICATFSEDLAKDGVDYANYVRLPRADLAVEAQDRQLCVTGVEHGARYEITLREGLPSGAGEELRGSVDLALYVRDRNPSVRFTGRAYVLPKSETASIPVVTINLDEAALRIHRVGPRGLRAVMDDNLLERAIDGYTEQRIAESLGEPVWEGVVETENRLNADVTTAIPVGDAIKDAEPGVYVMTARDPDGETRDWRDAATQWFVVTDLGLTALTGADGLHVFTRTLGGAAAVEGASLSLIAVNNAVLGEADTDAEGYARFAPGLTRGEGGNAPAMMTVETASGDFAFLDLTKPGFDFADRGVEGRAPAGPVDVFMTTERGAYRPGEVLNATILARDENADATRDLPLTAIVTRPDGVEYARFVLRDEGAGGRALSLPINAAALRGTWRLRVHADPDAQALAETSFLVEDFIPERIDFDLTLPEGPIRLGDAPMLEIAAQYLYGAPGADLAIEGETRIAQADGLPDWPGYRFGLHDEAAQGGAEPILDAGVTDADGDAIVTLAMPDMRETAHPMELTATLRLRDSSGRPVERSVTRALAPSGPRLGLKPLFEDAVSEGEAARFEAIAINAESARIGANGLRWSVERITTRYQWYELDGDWRYEPITTSERVASGEIDISADGAPATIEAPVEWGRYTLTLSDPDSPDLAVSTAFSAGWYRGVAGSDTPDLLTVSLDRKAYVVGDTARLKLEPRFKGTALVTVLDDGLVAMKAVEVAAEETVVELAVTPDWGAGAYVLASLIRPMDVEAGRNPSRAVGLSWAPVDPGPRVLEAAFTGPDESMPREALDASLKIEGLAANERAYATIAAVDVGVLNITGFEAPAPEDWYFGQRKLGVEMRDLYGRLIDGLAGDPGKLRSGGDGAGAGRASPPAPEDIVASFSGVMEADENGEISVSFDMPDFNGTVRLMAVAWTAEGVGHAVKDVLVRDPVVVTINAPRFLAPGDEARATVELAHAYGPTGEMGFILSKTGGLGLDAEPESFALEDGGLERFSFPLTGEAVGDPELIVEAVTPGGDVILKDIRVPVRANDPAIARTSRLSLKPGEAFALDSGLFKGLRSGTGRATLTVGPIARMNVAGLLQSLDRYPYGCAEQTTSRALPLLYLDDVAEALGLPGAEDLAGRVKKAVDRVLTMQANGGGFGMWGPGGGNYWLDAYVTDFLTRANTRGVTVPEQALEAALSNLRNYIAYAPDFDRGGEEIAYALLVLAREGRANIGDLRYYADAKGDALGTAMAKAQLGAALALYGEQRRADALFRKAQAHLDAQGNNGGGWREDYGTALRDAAGVLALASEANTEAVDIPALTARVADRHEKLSYTSTQEKAWTLLAARGLIEGAADSGLSLDGAPIDGPVMRITEPDAVATPMTLMNDGAEAALASLTVFGAPLEPAPAKAEGYAIEREYFTLEGEPVNVSEVALNARLVAVLTVRPGNRDRSGRLMIDDPLPAGFEIDNPNLLRGGGVQQLGWLSLEARPEYAAALTDRFIAAVDHRGGGRIRVAYILRAVSPGRFHQPAATVEDMYRPTLRGRTGPGTVIVSDAE